jgi:hypothetical protein
MTTTTLKKLNVGAAIRSMLFEGPWVYGGLKTFVNILMMCGIQLAM